MQGARGSSTEPSWRACATQTRRSTAEVTPRQSRNHARRPAQKTLLRSPWRSTADDSTAADKLRDEALRGHPALWIRWHGAMRPELPAVVARLHLPTQSSRSPVRYPLAPVTSTAVITLGDAVTPEARADALHRDQRRMAKEKRVAALPRDPGPIRCF